MKSGSSDTATNDWFDGVGNPGVKDGVAGLGVRVDVSCSRGRTNDSGVMYIASESDMDATLKRSLVTPFSVASVKVDAVGAAKVK